jgi:hypothetical protein
VVGGMWGIWRVGLGGEGGGWGGDWEEGGSRAD